LPCGAETGQRLVLVNRMHPRYGAKGRLDKCRTFEAVAAILERERMRGG
jgi:hypothetical protein